MNPFVSIIIPCYNGERYVGEAIESAIGQTYPHSEVIVIDDGSTDGSLDVIRAIGDRICWESGPNRGACAARNRGIELAKGDFIQFLDADDLLHPQKLAMQLPFAQSVSDSLVFCDGEMADGEPAHPHHVRSDSTDEPVLFMLRGGLPTTAPIHRKCLLKSVGGFCEDLPCAQERDLHLRIAAQGIRFRRLPKVLYTVRRCDDGLSANYERVLDQHARILWPVYRFLADRGELNDERAKHFAGMLARDARAYIRMGQRRKAREYFRQARQMHPSGGFTLAYSTTARFLSYILGTRSAEFFAMLRRQSRKSVTLLRSGSASTRHGSLCGASRDEKCQAT